MSIPAAVQWENEPSTNTPVSAANLKRVDERVDAVAAMVAPVVTGSGTLASGASAGTVSLEKSGTRVVAAVTVTCTGTSEVIGTVPAEFGSPYPMGHCFLVAADGSWWPVLVDGNQIKVLGPAPVGTVLNGSLTWKAES